MAFPQANPFYEKDAANIAKSIENLYNALIDLNFSSSTAKEFTIAYIRSER